MVRQSEQWFPREVREALAASGGAVTCLPVRMDGGAWESAVFFGLDGPECERDVARLAAAPTVPIALDTDVIQHDSAAVAVLRVEVLADEDDPLVGEVLLLPGAHTVHFETLDLLTRQARLGVFIGDQERRTILAQYLRLGDGERSEFRSMLDTAVRHDALVRMTGRYDPARAFAAVTANYALRHTPARTP